MSRESHEWVRLLRWLTLAERAVLDYLADYVNRNAVGAWPLIRTMAADLDVSASSVRLHIRKLEGKGHLKRKPVYGADGAQIGNIYLLNIGEGEMRPLRKARQDPYADWRVAALAGNEQGAYQEPDGGSEESTAPLSGNEQGGYNETNGAAVQNATGKEPTIEPTKEPPIDEGPLPAAAGDRSTRQPEFYRDDYNRVCVPLGLPKVIDLSKKRKAKLRARLLNRRFDWDAIMAKIPEAKWGVAQRILTFTFLIENDDNYLKVLEGNYDGRQAGRPKQEEPEPPEDTLPGGGLTRTLRSTWKRKNLERHAAGLPQIGWGEFLIAKRAGPQSAISADYPLEEAINAYPDEQTGRGSAAGVGETPGSGRAPGSAGGSGAEQAEAVGAAAPGGPSAQGHADAPAGLDPQSEQRDGGGI